MDDLDRSGMPPGMPHGGGGGDSSYRAYGGFETAYGASDGGSTGWHDAAGWQEDTTPLLLH